MTDTSPPPRTRQRGSANETDRRILALLLETGRTPQEIATYGVDDPDVPDWPSREYIHERLTRMHDLGWVDKPASGKYNITPEGRAVCARFASTDPASDSPIILEGVAEFVQLYGTDALQMILANRLAADERETGIADAPGPAEIANQLSGEIIVPATHVEIAMDELDRRLRDGDTDDLDVGAWIALGP